MSAGGDGNPGSTGGARFDHMAPELRGPRFWDAVAGLRRHGPLVWVEDYGGYWAATSHAVVRQIAQDHQTFSSGQGVTIGRPGPELQPYVMPIEADPPRQQVYRKKVNRHLSPGAVKKLEDRIRSVADELIDTFVERGSCDIVADFARRFPGTVFFRLVMNEDDQAFGEIEALARQLSFDPDPLRRAEAARRMRDWAAGVLGDRPSVAEVPDIVQAVSSLADSGVYFADHELNSGLQVLAQGGIGTSAQLIGSIVYALCERPDLRTQIRNDLGLVPSLLEEVLRLEPPVAMLFRTATRDAEIAGQRIRKGQMVGLFYAAANRDPAVFEHPDELDLDRRANPHVAFGLGVHRCVGSNLARLQVRVALEQLLRRLVDFAVPEGAHVEYVGAFQRGPASIPLRFVPGTRVELVSAR
jgi:cytochrome P450